jgi:hypothetical protein
MRTGSDRLQGACLAEYLAELSKQLARTFVLGYFIQNSVL